MKKIYLFVVVILSLFILTSCNLTDKSFKSLDTNYIPNKVTKDFRLESGEQDEFSWTSNNEEVLKIKDNYATVIQQEKDVLVTVTASVKKHKKDFKIIVLKKDSRLSPFEKAIEFMSLYKEVIIEQEGLFIPKKIDDLYLLFDDKLNDNKSTPTYKEYYGDIIVIDHLDTNHRELNIYFNEMIDGKLVQIHSNKIKLKYKQHQDLFFKLRSFDTYLKAEDDYLVIASDEEFYKYINYLDTKDVDELFLDYLEKFRNKNYYSYNNSLLLINVFQPTSDNEVILKNIKIDNNNLVVDIDTYYGTDDKTKIWPFVVEINKNLSEIKDVIIKLNYVDEKEVLYLNSYVYNYDHYLFDYLNKTIIIESLQELKDYINICDELQKDYGPNYLDNTYLDHLRKYDNKYFNDKKLVLVNYNSGSGSYEYLYKDFELNGNQLQINLKSNNPYIGTSDIRPWNYIFEVSKLLVFDEVITKVQRNKVDFNPLIKKALPTIIFADDNYNIDNVYKPAGSLLDHQKSLENKYNIDFNDEIIVINQIKAFKEIYYILKGEKYNNHQNLEGYVWLLVKRVAGGSQFINIDYSIYDQYIGYNHPNGKEPGDAALFNCLDIIQITLDDYNSLYNLNFVNMND